MSVPGLCRSQDKPTTLTTLGEIFCLSHVVGSHNHPRATPLTLSLGAERLPSEGDSASVVFTTLIRIILLFMVEHAHKGLQL